MTFANTFSILIEESYKSGWNDQSQIVLLCNFLDQLHARFPGTEDDGIEGDFRRYLQDQARREEEESIDNAEMDPRYTIGNHINPNLINDDYEDGDPEKQFRWEHAVSMHETTQGLDEWIG